MKNIKLKKYLQGDVLVSVIVFSVIAITITVGLVNWGAALLRNIQGTKDREQALQIAEAGIDYYRWHLAHSPSDFKDGTNQPGPYVHNFTDKDGTVIGNYALTITPPTTGSTIVTIVSKGTIASNTNISRSIKVVMAIPSLAQYATAANDDMRFGPGTEVFGPIHSNKGIRFDGLAHNVISSSLSTYNDPDHSGNSEFGVHTHIVSGSVVDTFRALEAPPSTVQSRPDVFQSGRLFPVPAIDFVGLTTNFSQLKTLAQSSGKYFAFSSSQGYHIVLKNNNTFDIYKVTALKSAPSQCTSDGALQWGTWSIKDETLLANYPIPANGVIFVEDHVWVDGLINGSRVTIAAAKLPDPGSGLQPNITINNDLVYTKKDGTDSIGLIAQGNINVGLFSEDVLEIDASLVAQNGRVGRFYYSSSCKSGQNNYYIRSSLSLYGMIATNLRYGFAYTDGTGYQTRNISYDSHLLYGPPPSFPLTSSYYQVLSWQEVR